MKEWRWNSGRDWNRSWWFFQLQLGARIALPARRSLELGHNQVSLHLTYTTNRSPFLQSSSRTKCNNFEFANPPHAQHHLTTSLNSHAHKPPSQPTKLGFWWFCEEKADGFDADSDFPTKKNQSSKLKSNKVHTFTWIHHHHRRTLQLPTTVLRLPNSTQTTESNT